MKTAVRLGRWFFAILLVVGGLDTVTLTRTAGDFSDSTISSMLVCGLVGSIVL